MAWKPQSRLSMLVSVKFVSFTDTSQQKVKGRTVRRAVSLWIEGASYNFSSMQRNGIGMQDIGSPVACCCVDRDSLLFVPHVGSYFNNWLCILHHLPRAWRNRGSFKKTVKVVSSYHELLESNRRCCLLLVASLRLKWFRDEWKDGQNITTCLMTIRNAIIAARSRIFPVFP